MTISRDKNLSRKPQDKRSLANAKNTIALIGCPYGHIFKARISKRLRPHDIVMK